MVLVHKVQEGFGGFDDVRMEQDLVYYGFDFGVMQELFELIDAEADYQHPDKCTEERTHLDTPIDFTLPALTNFSISFHFPLMSFPHNLG